MFKFDTKSTENNLNEVGIVTLNREIEEKITDIKVAREELLANNNYNLDKKFILKANLDGLAVIKMFSQIFSFSYYSFISHYLFGRKLTPLNWLNFINKLKNQLVTVNV